MDDILPEAGPIIDCDDIPADRMELRQVAGISAGGCMELRPGSYDFGPVQQGPGRLDDGDPDSVGFTLSLNGNLTATIGPGENPVKVDNQPVVEPTTLGGRVINAGSARFVVARPRPPQRRGGPIREIRLDAVDPWVWQPIPEPGGLGTESYPLIHQRRRFHYSPDEVCHRIGGGRDMVWDRDQSHPLFGTAVVGMADIPLRGVGVEIAAPVPVSIDLFTSPTMMVGQRDLQLAVARHILLSLAASSHPDDLQIALLSDRPDLEFVTELPHANGVGASSGDSGHGRRLFILDRSEGLEKWPLNGLADERSSVLALTSDDDVLSPAANILTVMNESSISVLGGGGQSAIDSATPVGFAAPMALALAKKLSEVHRSARATT
jgi:hypothetical protein